MITGTELPPSSELFPLRDLASRHPTIFSESRLKWALRNRARNGLSDARAVFESRGGELILHEPTFLAWFLGLSGRDTPRSSRRVRK